MRNGQHSFVPQTFSPSLPLNRKKAWIIYHVSEVKYWEVPDKKNAFHAQVLRLLSSEISSLKTSRTPVVGDALQKGTSSFGLTYIDIHVICRTGIELVDYFRFHTIFGMELTASRHSSFSTVLVLPTNLPYKNIYICIMMYKYNMMSS